MGVSKISQRFKKDSWEESFLLKFSRIMRMSTKGHEEKILNLMLEE